MVLNIRPVFLTTKEYLKPTHSSTRKIVMKSDDECEEYMVTICDQKDINGEIVIPESYKGKPITQIGVNAFRNCDKITRVILPDSVEIIDEYAFCGCSKLTELRLPGNLKLIKFRAFNDTGLTKIVMPGFKVRGFAEYFPRNIEIIVNDDNPVYKLEGNCLIDIGGNILVRGNKISIIPNSIESIGALAFSGCGGLTQIKIPDNVKTIEKNAFSDCVDLHTAELPENINEIPERAFSGCAGLINVKTGGNIARIGEHAFDGCASLKKIFLPESLEEIGSSAFYKCANLTSINLPNNLKSIGDGAFSQCSRLENMTIPNSVIDIGPWAFSEKTLTIKVVGHTQKPKGWSGTWNGKKCQVIWDVMEAKPEEIVKSGVSAEDRCNHIKIKLEKYLEELSEDNNEPIRYNPPLPLEEIEAFEKRYGFKLPEEYRKFLLIVGDGGKMIDGFNLLKLSELEIDEENIKNDFPLDDAWIWEDDEDNDEEDDDKIGKVFVNGNIALIDIGCGMTWRIIVSGKLAGEMWSLCGEGAAPCHPRRGFLDWFEFWLDGGEN